MIKQCPNCKKNFRRRPQGNHRIYCTPQCCFEASYEKRRLRSLEWARRARLKKCKEDRENKTKCLICKRWYYGLGGHVWNAHGIKSREYKLKFGLMLSKPLHSEFVHERESAAWEKKKHIVLQNLEKGAKYRYKKGQTFENRILVPARKAQLAKQIKHYHRIQKNRKVKVIKKQEKLEEIKLKFGDQFESLRNLIVSL